eukprot:TRINITY_DN4214_c0_g2_i1.p1 TRINITY_DN4214_c0_g2~~TRINITY_DN4214_c0_g2_i1.p1  ORF type:complete len:127 (-),score=12.37 TRINITY_DN4214_c0_g2_i1:2-382(-)
MALVLFFNLTIQVIKLAYYTQRSFLDPMDNCVYSMDPIKIYISKNFAFSLILFLWKIINSILLELFPVTFILDIIRSKSRKSTEKSAITRFITSVEAAHASQSREEVFENSIEWERNLYHNNPQNL